MVFVVDASEATSTFDPSKNAFTTRDHHHRDPILDLLRTTTISFSSIASNKKTPTPTTLITSCAKSKIEERERRSRSTHHLCLRGVRRGAQRHGGRDDRGDRFPGDGDDRLRGGCVIAVLLLRSRSPMGGSNHRRRRGRSSSGSSGPGDDARRRAAARQTRHARRRR